jgi:hypothetical protein
MNHRRQSAGNGRHDPQTNPKKAGKPQGAGAEQLELASYTGQFIW